MSFPTYDLFTARRLGLFRTATLFVKCSHSLFLVRGHRPFYLEATLADILDLGLREARSGASL